MQKQLGNDLIIKTMKNKTQLTNNDLFAIQSAILKLGEEKIDIDVALELVNVMDLIITEIQKHKKAIEISVKFTKDEQEVSKLINQLNESLNETNKEETVKKLTELETTHKELLESIKNKKIQISNIEKEIGEKPISITIKPCIDKSKLPSMHLWQIAALKPLFK